MLTPGMGCLSACDIILPVSGLVCAWFVVQENKPAISNNSGIKVAFFIIRILVVYCIMYDIIKLKKRFKLPRTIFNAMFTYFFAFK